uniref:Uncharacterized protein n=1 Tax=Ditylum brightwellii TaxID=49249 RepID=A0A7S4WIU9_9STRA
MYYSFQHVMSSCLMLPCARSTRFLMKIFSVVKLGSSNGVFTNIDFLHFFRERLTSSETITSSRCTYTRITLTLLNVPPLKDRAQRKCIRGYTSVPPFCSDAAIAAFFALTCRLNSSNSFFFSSASIRRWNFAG